MGRPTHHVPWITHLHEAHPLNLFGLKKRVPGKRAFSAEMSNKNRYGCLIMLFFYFYMFLYMLFYAFVPFVPLRFLCFLGAPRMLGHDAREAIIANMVHLRRHEEIGFVPFREQSPNSANSAHRTKSAYCLVQPRSEKTVFCSAKVTLFLINCLIRYPLVDIGLRIIISKTWIVHNLSGFQNSQK